MGQASRPGSVAKGLAVASLVLGAIPLPLYPGVIIADVMALAASGGRLRLPAALSEWLMLYVIVAATLYPAVWIFALVRSLALMRSAREPAAMRVALVPVAVLISLAVAVFLASATAAVR